MSGDESVLDLSGLVVEEAAITRGAIGPRTPLDRGGRQVSVQDGAVPERFPVTPQAPSRVRYAWIRLSSGVSSPEAAAREILRRGLRLPDREEAEGVLDLCVKQCSQEAIRIALCGVHYWTPQQTFGSVGRTRAAMGKIGVVGIRGGYPRMSVIIEVGVARVFVLEPLDATYSRGDPVFLAILP